MNYVCMPLSLYSALCIAQRKPQRLHNRKKPLKRIDVLLEPEIYQKLCEIHQSFLEDSRKNGYSQLTLSEVMRVIIGAAITHESQRLSL